MNRNEQFSEAVKGIVGRRSQREISRLTGISPTYIGDMLWGYVPSFRILERLVEGLHPDPEQVQRLFEAAGYEPKKPSSTAPSPAEALETIIESVEELEYDPEFEGVTIRGYMGAENLTPEQIELANRVVRALLTLQRRKRGEE